MTTDIVTEPLFKAALDEHAKLIRRAESTALAIVRRLINRNGQFNVDSKELVVGYSKADDSPHHYYQVVDFTSVLPVYIVGEPSMAINEAGSVFMQANCPNLYLDGTGSLHYGYHAISSFPTIISTYSLDELHNHLIDQLSR